MKNYEIMFILNSVDRRRKKANVELVESILTKAGLRNLKLKFGGDRRLTPNQKKRKRILRIDYVPNRRN